VTKTFLHNVYKFFVIYALFVEMLSEEKEKLFYVTSSRGILPSVVYDVHFRLYETEIQTAEEV
jgi:hypothetical protein